MNEHTRDFIKKHRNAAIHSLAFLSEKHPDVDMQLAIRQISGKQKIKEKVPAFFECEDLLYPPTLSLEQSSSEVTAKHKASRCHGAKLIDLTGGFGVDSYFFSFRFDNVVFVEKQRELCELAEHNFRALKRHNIEVVNDTAECFLERTDRADWIYLDPARRTESGRKVVLPADCEPDVQELAEKLLAKSSHVMIKLSPMIDIVSVTKELPKVTEIQITAVENECKEVVVILQHQETEQVQVKTTNYPNNGLAERFNFLMPNERSAQVYFTSELSSYLYEPNAAIMKSGAFKSVSSHFKIEKLHTNSHLYTSDKHIPDFPGRIFKVEKTYDFGKSSLKELHSDVKKANLTIRNFPLSVNELRRKLKLSEGGEIFLFATTLGNGKKALIRCKKIK